MGQTSAEPNHVTCNSLKLQGELKSGIYVLKNKNEAPRFGFCDMAEQGYLNGELEKSIGYKIEAFPGEGRIMFSAAKIISGNAVTIPTGTDITYNEILDNVGDAMDIETGKFTCPMNGTYKFTFTALGKGSTNDAASVLLNGNKQFLIYNNDNNFGASLNHAWTFILQKNDIVNLKVERGDIYLDANIRWSFSGYMIQAE